MDDCNCNSSTCDCCVNKPTTIQTETTTLLTPAYFNDKSVSSLTNAELLATQNVVLDVAATLTLFNTNVLNNAAFDKTEYTFVTDRLSEGAITQTEYREFLNEYNYTVETATNNILSNPKNHIEQFNDFLKVTIAGVAVSSLCRFLSDPFNKITSTISLFSDFLGGFKSLKELLASLENPLDALSGLAASLKAFANSLINSVKDIVNSIKDKVSNVADKVSKEIAKIVGLQGNNKLSLNRWFAKQFSNIQIALSESNIANLTKDISTKIAEAVLGFAELTIEAIQFLLFLFCKMATAVENNLMSLLDIVTTAASKIAGVNSSLLIGSGDSLRSAVEAGRPVPEAGTLAAQCQEYAARVNAQGTNASTGSSGVPAGVTPIYTPYTNSSHPDPLTGWKWLRFDPNGNVLKNTWFSRNGYGNIPADVGYYKTDLRALELLDNVGEIMQQEFLIASAYRHPPYNVAIGGASNSVHMSGRALDVHNNSARPSDPLNDEFRRICRSVGFIRFGRYRGSNFTHIDLGWDASSSPAAWEG